MKVIVKEECLYPEPSDSGQTIPVGSPAWFSWLVQHDRFVYQDENGQFTARREVRRGSYYWYGYRRQGGKLHKVYLGKSDDLTLSQLIAAGAKLTGQDEVETPAGQAAPLDLETSLRTVVDGAAQLKGNVAANIPFALMTQLTPPTLPLNLVARPRLIKQINTPITLIVAPSGFGKTVLLNQWRFEMMNTSRESRMMNDENSSSSFNHHHSHVAWVSLEAEECNPHTFWTTITTALQQIDPLIGETVSILLQSPTALSIEQILAGLIHNLNRWQEAQLERRLALIIDNYQQVRAPDIDATCQFFLDHLPVGVQVIMAGQTPFPFAVQRWRVKGILTELTSDDLRLTPEEGVAWLDRTVTIPLTAREKLSLAVRTQGWAAGLNLLALALKTQDDVHRFIATFDGHHPFLQAFFVEEILSKHPPDQQRFLLQTSILRNFNGSLCDAVTERNDSEHILHHLYRANQFITLVDKAQGWYQYHELFAQALQYQLQHHSPHQIPALHRRAAAWYQDHELYSEVIRHLVQVEAWLELGQVIDQVVLDQLRRGSDNRILKWFRQLPDELFLHHDTLLLTYARLAMPSLPHDQVRNLLSRITGRIEATPSAARTAGQQALVARLNEWERTVAAGRAPEPPESLSREIEQVGYLLDLYYQGRCLIRQEKFVASEKTLSQTLELGRAQGLVFIVLMAGGALAYQWAAQGRLGDSERLARDILQYTLSHTETLPTCASIPLTILSEIYHARNHLAQAKQFIDDAVIVDPNSISLNSLMHHHVLLAHIFNAQNNRPATRATLQAMIELEPYASHLITVQDLKIHRALLYVRQGRPVEAEQLLRQISAYPLPAHQAELDLLRIVWAELFLAQQQYHEAEAILTEPEKTKVPASLFILVPTIELLLAQAYWGQQKMTESRREMRRAIRIAESEGITRPFLDCGPPLIPLLTAMLHTKKVSRKYRQFISRLLDEFQAAYPQISTKAAVETARGAAEHLSAREQEVLHLLDKGLDNKALARQLALADSTVRTHLRNIFRKLNVDSRTQALRRARQLRLL